jgi:alkyl sulfatase BDS1-like metallo-beta-lactamase superfamily hydrolase
MGRIAYVGAKPMTTRLGCRGMADLLELSARIIDGDLDESGSRITLELSEVAPGVAVVESFSNVVAFDSGDGLVLFDASLQQLAGFVIGGLRTWSDAPVHTLVYTHGHVDHVGGARAFLAAASERGERRPDVVAHEAVPQRFSRYDLTNGYNAVINQRQFARSGLVDGMDASRPPVFPHNWVQPSVTYRDQLDVKVGDLQVELHHGLGETDDHTWAWLPERRAVCVGDFIIWAFPNAGNPQKVQRYPLEWARVLREIEALEPELLLPAHGLPVGGRARVKQLLDETATALESLVDQTLRLMNEGASLDTIVHSVAVPAGLLERPYLRPTYDDPEFVVRNIWRRYGGWYDGNPANLKPAPSGAVALEVAKLSGGAPALAAHALELAAGGDGDLRVAAHLVEMAAQAAPDDPAVHDARAQIYTLRRGAETSLMAKAIFGAAAAESDAVSP